MNFSPKTLILPLCLLLAACGNGTNAADTPQDSIDPTSAPSSLQFKGPTITDALSDDEKEELFALLKERRFTNPKDFLLTERQESPEDQQDRETQLAQSSVEMQALIARAKSTCQIRPIDQITLTTGTGTKTISTMTEDGVVNGMDCPVSIRSFSKTVSSIERVDSSEPFQGLIRVRNTKEENVLLQDLENVLPFFVLNQNLKSETGSLIDVTEQETRSIVKFRVLSTTDFVDGLQLKMNGRGEVLITQAKAPQAGTRHEAIFEMDFQLREKTYRLNLHLVEVDGTIETKKLYLNGELVNEDLFESLNHLNINSTGSKFSSPLR